MTDQAAQCCNQDAVRQLHAVYEVCGVRLASRVPFPELDHADATPDWFFELGGFDSPALQATDWIHHCYLPNRKLWRSSAKFGPSYLLRFHELAEFCVVPRAATIQCNPQPPTPLDIIRRLLIDHVVPLTLSLNSRAAIHASSITTPRGAIGFVGMSGCGKSTLAASFVAAGHALLGDDCLALKQDHGPIVATPSGAGMWLSAEVATALSIEFGSIAPRKKRIAAPGAKLDAPVVGLFVLAASEPGTSVEMTRLSQADGLMELVRHAFRLDVTDQPMLARQFSLLSQLVQQAPVYRLKYPREFLVLPAVRRVILQSIEGELGR